MLIKEHTDSEQILSLLASGESDENIRRVIADIQKISRMLDADCFPASPCADQYLQALRQAYRDDLYALYGSRAGNTAHPGSSFLQLEQMRRDLLLVAARHLERSGRLTYRSRAQGHGYTGEYAIKKGHG